MRAHIFVVRISSAADGRGTRTLGRSWRPALPQRGTERGPL